jgi:cytoskeleton protein RodZ
MVQFSVKKIQPQTAGEIFKKNREEIGQSLDDVCRTIKVNKKYLEALEEGNYSELSIGFYTEKFFKTYADYLNLEFEPLWKLYSKERKFFDKKDSSGFVKAVSPRSFVDASKIIKICIGGLIIMVLLGYLGWEIRKIFLPPYLEVMNPVDNLITSQSTVKVTGQTEKETEISINGQEISSSQDGFFSEDVNLQEGLNVIEISSKKKHSKENTIFRRVMVVTEKNN